MVELFGDESVRLAPIGHARGPDVVELDCNPVMVLERGAALG